MVGLTDEQISMIDDMALDPDFVAIQEVTVVHQVITCTVCKRTLDSWNENGCGGCNEDCPHSIEITY